MSLLRLQELHINKNPTKFMFIKEMRVKAIKAQKLTCQWTLLKEKYHCLKSHEG